MITDTSKKRNIQVYDDDSGWVDEHVPGSCAAARWSKVLKFYMERHGRPYYEAIIKDYLQTGEGQKIIRRANSD